MLSQYGEKDANIHLEYCLYLYIIIYIYSNLKKCIQNLLCIERVNCDN